MYTVKRFGKVRQQEWPSQDVATMLQAGQEAQRLANEGGGYFYALDSAQNVVFVSEHRCPAPRSLNDRRFGKPNPTIVSILEREHLRQQPSQQGGLRPQPIPVLRRL